MSSNRSYISSANTVPASSLCTSDSGDGTRVWRTCSSNSGYWMVLSFRFGFGLVAVGEEVPKPLPDDFLALFFLVFFLVAFSVVRWDDEWLLIIWWLGDGGFGTNAVVLVARRRLHRLVMDAAVILKVCDTSSCVEVMVPAIFVLFGARRHSRFCTGT